MGWFLILFYFFRWNTSFINLKWFCHWRLCPLWIRARTIIPSVTLASTRVGAQKSNDCRAGGQPCSHLLHSQLLTGFLHPAVFSWGKMRSLFCSLPVQLYYVTEAVLKIILLKDNSFNSAKIYFLSTYIMVKRASTSLYFCI